MPATASTVVEQALQRFRGLSSPDKITELDAFASVVEASRASAGGMLPGQTRSETDAILSGMMQILNDDLPSEGRVDLSDRNAVAEDVVFAARQALMHDRNGR